MGQIVIIYSNSRAAWERPPYQYCTMNKKCSTDMGWHLYPLTFFDQYQYGYLAAAWNDSYHTMVSVYRHHILVCMFYHNNKV